MRIPSSQESGAPGARRLWRPLFFTGVGLGQAGVIGWKGALFAALGQPSGFSLLLIISSALQAAAEFRLLTLVAVLTLVTLPSMAGWSLQRLSLRSSSTR